MSEIKIQKCDDGQWPSDGLIFTSVNNGQQVAMHCDAYSVEELTRGMRADNTAGGVAVVGFTRGLVTLEMMVSVIDISLPGLYSTHGSISSVGVTMGNRVAAHPHMVLTPFRWGGVSGPIVMMLLYGDATTGKFALNMTGRNIPMCTVYSDSHPEVHCNYIVREVIQ